MLNVLLCVALVPLALASGDRCPSPRVTALGWSADGTRAAVARWATDRGETDAVRVEVLDAGGHVVEEEAFPVAGVDRSLADPS